jgi:nucleoside-diphosphate-sugar epimerase
MMKIAVVGATGPTGIHLVAELRKTVASVRVIARSTDRLARLFPEAAVEKWPADVLEADATLRAIEGCDLVYDCIGLPGDQMHLHPVTARNIAGALRHTKVRCVQVSSYWAYYPQVPTEINESHPRIGGPPWVRHRREAEDVLCAAGAAILHLPDFYGPPCARQYAPKCAQRGGLRQNGQLARESGCSTRIHLCPGCHAHRRRDRCPYRGPGRALVPAR